MDRITISPDSTADDLAGIALCVHQLFGGLPVTARSRNRPGVQVENGRIKSKTYTGPVLEQVLAGGRVIKARPAAGVYEGIPVVVAPVMLGGAAIAAIGVVDTSGALDIKAFMDEYAAIEKQVIGHK